MNLDEVVKTETYDGPCPLGHPAAWTSTWYRPFDQYDHLGHANSDYTLADFSCPTCGDA